MYLKDLYMGNLLLLSKMEELPIFVRTFGSSPTIRILNFMLTSRELDFSMSDVARNSDVSWSTLNRVWGSLLKFELIKYTRKIGKAKLFKLNLENPVVKDLVKIYDKLLIKETKDYFAKKKIKVPA